jgi:hypothetical protein
MTVIDYPNSPTLNQKFTSGGHQWSWDGQKWVAGSGAGGGQVYSVAGRTGDVVLTHIDITDWTAATTALPFLPLAGGQVTGPIYGMNTGPGGQGQFHMSNGSGYGSMWYNDGTNTYLLLTANGDYLGSYNSLRPIRIDNSIGSVIIGAPFWVVGSGGTGPVVVQIQGADFQSQTFSNFTARRWRLAVNSGDEPSAGSIDYRGFDGAALGIVGAGTTASNRLVRVWDNLTVNGNLTVNSILTVSGSFSAASISTSGSITTTSNFIGNGGHLYLQEAGTNQWCIYVDADVFRVYSGNAGDHLQINNAGEIYSVRGSIHSAVNLYAASQLNVAGGVLYNRGDGWFGFNQVFRVPDFYSDGNINTSGQIFFAGVSWYNGSGWVTTGQPIHTGSSLQVDGSIVANGNITGGLVYTGKLLGGPGNAGHLGTFNTNNGVNFRWDSSNGYLLYRIDEALEYGIVHTTNLTGGINACTEPGTASGWSICHYYYGTLFEVFVDGVSDRRVKMNIRDTEVDALVALCAIPVRSFEWTPEHARTLGHEVARRPVAIGLVAQEMPSDCAAEGHTHDATPGLMKINYERLHGYYIRAIQQLEARLAQLEAR